MGLILSIETATPVCSVALHEEGKIKALQELHIEKSHATQLTQVIEDILKKANYSFQGLKAIAISKGPGSYTGLRIGLSTAKGLCFALGIPLISIGTLESMTQKMIAYNSRKNALLCPMLDARRMEVYCRISKASGGLIQEDKAVILDESSFVELLEKNEVLFFGDGAEKFKSLVETNPKAFFVDDFTCSAVGMGDLAYKKFCAGEFENLAYFEPFYLKPFHTTTPKKKLL